MGEAAQFDAVASVKLTMQTGLLGRGLYRYPAQAFTSASACAFKASVSGTTAETQIGEDLILLAGPGTTAARFVAGRGGYGGVIVENDVATAGGRLRGEAVLQVAGAIDTTGTHPRLPSCQQAMVDMQTGSAMLAALTPTVDLGSLTITGDDLTISVGPGLQVITASRISVLPGVAEGYRTGGTLTIDRSSNDPVILNVAKLRIGDLSSIFDVDIINVPGKGPAVSLGLDATAPAILAPARSISTKPTGDNGNLNGLYGRRIRLRGAGVNPADVACTP
jgi:hypothetical protein